MHMKTIIVFTMDDIYIDLKCINKNAYILHARRMSKYGEVCQLVLTTMKNNGFGQAVIGIMLLKA